MIQGPGGPETGRVRVGAESQREPGGEAGLHLGNGSDAMVRDTVSVRRTDQIGLSILSTVTRLAGEEKIPFRRGFWSRGWLGQIDVRRVVSSYRCVGVVL